MLTRHLYVVYLTECPETLTNDFFVHLLDENMTWSPQSSYVDDDDDDDGKCYYHGSSPKTPGKVWTASRVDLVLGSNSQLRAICEGSMVVLIVVRIF